MSVENIVVVDPEGIIRGVFSVADRDKVNAMIDLINNPAPVSELKPKSLYYGLTGKVGVESIITLSVENTGLRPLEVTDIKSTTAQVLIERTSFTVQPGAVEKVKLILSPTQAGTLTGTVTVTTNEKTWSLPISSIAIEGSLPPAITLPATALDYGTVEVGRAGSKTIEIRNEGQGPLKVTELQSDIAGLTFSSQSFTIAAGGSETVTVSITPTTEGAISGMVTVLSDDPTNGSLTISLAGSAQVIRADPRVDFDGSGTVDFGDFLGFAGAFGTTDVAYDVDMSGSVDFNDFLTFVENFGRQI